MSYLRNQPVAGDDLGVSAPILQNNTNKADDSFGIDHYAFSNQTVNNGKHNQITTPAFIANPPTALPPVTIASEPKMYAFQDSANLGVINYSRGPLDAVPTPLTHLQSPATPLVLTAGATTPVLDFTGLTRAIGVLYMANLEVSPRDTVNSANVAWDGTNLIVDIQSSSLEPSVAGKILQVKNATGLVFSQVFWTLDLVRSS